MKYVPINIYKEEFTSRIKSLKDWSISEKEKKKLVSFLEDLELGKVNKGRKISKTRQCKYLTLLKVPLESFPNDLDKLKMKDLEDFEKALTSGKLKNRYGREYEHNTKSDIKIALKVYLRWRLKEKALAMTEWLDTRKQAKTPDYLKESEVIKLYKSCKSNRERYLVAILFDTGTRATEFFNIRLEDIQLPEGKDNFVKITLKEEYSKTKGRVVGLFWKYSLEAIRDYLEERKLEGIKSDEPIFKDTYDSARLFLSRRAKKIIGRPIYFHLFRHSSATFYASKMNRQELCYRYGWAFSSRMPDVYISRAGMENKDLDEKFRATELEEVRSQLSKEEFERRKLQEKVEQFMKQEEDRQARRDKAFEFLEQIKNDKSNLLNDEAFLRKRLEALTKRK